jgi:hypothetical protein
MLKENLSPKFCLLRITSKEEFTTEAPEGAD